jgi:hypothetical protein
MISIGTQFQASCTKISVFGKHNKSSTSLVDRLNTYQNNRISFYTCTWHCNNKAMHNMASITVLVKASP